MQWTFFIEQLSNGSWILGWSEGGCDYGRQMPNRAGFATYEDAEKYALSKLRTLMRKQRDKWTNEARLNAALKSKAAS